MILEKRVLLAACAYTVNDLGKEKINFTLPIFMQSYSFLTAKPSQLSRALLFAAPFTGEVNYATPIRFQQLKFIQKIFHLVK